MKRAFAFAVLTCVVSALATVPASAQAAQLERAPILWTMSGETLNDFKVSFEPAKPLDQSGAEACVRSFLWFANGKADQSALADDLESGIQSVVRRELQNSLDLALAKEVRTDPEPSPDRASGTGGVHGWELTVVNDDDQEDWDKPFETLPGSRGAEGVRILISLDGRKPARGRFVTCYAFLCRESADGLWRIADLSRYFPETPPIRVSGIGTVSGGPHWGRFDPGFGTLHRMTPHIDEPIHEPESRLDTKVSLMDAFFRDILQRRLQIRLRLLYRMQAAWLDAIRPLFLPDYVNTLEETASHMAKQDSPANVGYEILEYRDDPVGVVVRKSDHYNTQWVFEINEKDGLWQITDVKRRFTAMRVRDRKEVERLQDVDSIWATATETTPTAYTLALFLPA